MAIPKSKGGKEGKRTPELLHKGFEHLESQMEQGKDQITTGLDISDDSMKHWCIPCPCSEQEFPLSTQAKCHMYFGREWQSQDPTICFIGLRRERQLKLFPEAMKFP